MAGAVVEYGWCVELGDAASPQYLTVEGQQLAWTLDNNKALRFCRQQDAEAVASILPEYSRVAEHAWY